MLDHPDWHGWHIVGRHLITPQRDKITPDVLAHLITMHKVRLHFESVAGLNAQAARSRRKRLQGAQQAVRVVVVDLGAWKAAHGLCSA